MPLSTAYSVNLIFDDPVVSALVLIPCTLSISFESRVGMQQYPEGYSYSTHHFEYFNQLECGLVSIKKK